MARKPIKHMFRHLSEKIRVYTALETIEDPYEKNITREYLNPRTIKAIVADLSPAKVNWKMPGITTERAKEIIIEKKHENLLKLSGKIVIDGDEYEGWRVNGKLSYKKEHDYIRAYIYRKEGDDGK